MDHIDWLRRHNSGIRAIAFWFGVRTMFWSRSTFFTCTLFFKWLTTNKIQLSVFSSPDPKDQVSYCHHLASVVVVRRKPFQKSTPLKVLDQWKPNLVWIITMVSSFKNMSGDAVHQPTWPLLLKIEHMVKLQVFGNRSKTVNNIKNLTGSKNDQHSKIYLPCNFEVNPITHFGVIVLFHQIF